jgi:hypothetical protein
MAMEQPTFCEATIEDGRYHFVVSATEKQHNGAHDGHNLLNEEIMLVMAYTDDYSVGKLCEEVNRTYAKRYGYRFHSVVETCETMLNSIQPKMHFTWYKIYILLSLMRDNISLMQKPLLLADNPPIQYLCWIDGDALVLQYDISIQSIIEKAHYKDLIIAEDMHPGCLINAGVFFIKVSEWSLSFLEEVWNSTKYDNVFFYEQSAMMKALKHKREPLHRLKPFHSYSKNGPQGVKLFPHVAVMPHTEFSSNVGVHKTELESLLKTQGYETTVLNHTYQSPDYDVSNMLIYHAAGLRGKLDYLRAVVIKYDIPCCIHEEEFRNLSFKLNRNSLGHYTKNEETGADGEG